MGINKEFLLPNAKQIRHFSFGGKLLDCRESLKEAINNRSDDYLPIQWYTSDPYNAGQAVTLLELSNYSFHMYHQGEGTGYSFTILTSLRECTISILILLKQKHLEFNLNKKNMMRYWSC